MGDIVRVVRRGKFIGWYIRYKDADGRRKQRASKQPTCALARRMLVEIEARVARGWVGIEIPNETIGMTVADLCKQFLCEFTSPRIKDVTRYRAAARTALGRVVAQVGDIPLSTLSRSHVERVRDAIGRKFRPNTVRASMAPLGTALTWAVRQGYISNNPARGVEMPRRERSIEYLAADEAARLLGEAERRARRKDEAMWGSRWMAVSLALRLGLRRGEVFGLRWQDIDFQAARVSIARSYRLSPKSGKTRHLPLSSALLPLLREWKDRCPQTSEHLVCPVLYAGRWGMSSNRATHGLATLLRAANCKPLTRGWHALRHTFASQFIMQGGHLLTLQKLLGHSTVEMTMVYAHLAPDFIANDLERLKY